jgi:ribosomal protein S18 acetylase RimI-like enzyme
MSLIVREMGAGEAEPVAEMVRELACGVGSATEPRLTAQGLDDARDLVDVVVGEDEGRLVGACLSLMTFSTWRGVRGLYIVDLFVAQQARGRNVGIELLRRAAARGMARGARFIKLEVDRDNAGAARFYERLGFARKEEDRLFVLEEDGLGSLMSRRERQ